MLGNMSGTEVYRRVCDLISVVGNRTHIAYSGTTNEQREYRTRPKDLRHWALRLRGEAESMDTSKKPVAIGKKLTDGRVYLMELDLTVSAELFADARAYNELFRAMGTSLSTQDFYRILTEHPELLTYL